MGGGFPTGHEYNFWGSNASLTAHVVNNWKGPMVFSGTELGRSVSTGGPLMAKGPPNDPVRAAYIYYTYHTSRFSWDPLTVLYAINGLGDFFDYGNDHGYNLVHPNGSNTWIMDESVTNQHYLKLKVNNETVAAELDRLFLEGAWSVSLKVDESPKSSASRTRHYTLHHHEEL